VLDRPTVLGRPDGGDDVSWREPVLDEVVVDGGPLVVGRWGSGSQVVVASHGITANHRTFGLVAAELETRGADVTLLAVDHRGRGGSAAHRGPYGLRTHAGDLVAVLDHVGAEQGVVVGHSMGAFIAANTAELAPERVTGLVLVDGALPIAVDLPDDADVEDVVRAVIGPALDRLDLTFASVEEYLERWRAHPAFQGDAWNDVTEAVYRYDLVRDGDEWRSGVIKAAVLEDGRGPMLDRQVATALARIDTPSRLLYAPRGLLDQVPGLFPAELVAEVTSGLDHVEVELVEDTNHYSILLGAHGAGRIADAVLAALRDAVDRPI
jgi:lipase